MGKLFQPKVLVPMIVSIGILTALVAFADVKKMLSIMESFERLALLLVLLLMIVYETVRCTQWHFLLGALGIRVPVRAQVFSFVGGEVTKNMPIGNYFQNYLLQVAQGTDFGLTSAATTLIILTEVAVSILGVLVLGLGTWTVWLRPLIIIGLAVFGLLVWLTVKLHGAGSPPWWISITRHQLARRALEELRNFREGAASLLHVRILAVQLVLGSVYLLIGATILYVVVIGLHVDRVTLLQAMAVYFFSLAFALIFPVPVDIGVLELSGVGAFLAIGIDRNTAVSVMLVNRVLNIGASLAISLIVMAFLPDQMRAIFRREPQRHVAQPIRSEQAE